MEDDSQPGGANQARLNLVPRHPFRESIIRHHENRFASARLPLCLPTFCTDGFPEASRTRSRARLHSRGCEQTGQLVFLSGQVANDPSGQLVGKADLKAQAEQVFANLKTALSAAGATFNDVVKINWYIKGYKSEDLPVLRGVRDKFVNTSAPPASTLVGVASRFQDDYLIEVDAIAVVAEKDAGKK